MWMRIENRGSRIRIDDHHKIEFKFDKALEIILEQAIIEANTYHQVTMNKTSKTSNLSIKELYDSYSNQTQNKEFLFDEMTQRIESNENIGQLLKLMNQCVVDRT